MVTTPAEDRALHEHVRTLRRIKLTFNEDELWVMYRLLATERTTGSPTLLPDLPRELDHAMGMALAKVSDAVLTLQDRKVLADV